VSRETLKAFDPLEEIRYNIGLPLDFQSLSGILPYKDLKTLARVLLSGF